MNILHKSKSLQNFLPYLILSVSFIFCIYKIDLTWFNTHMARDLARTQDWLNFSPSTWLGPEMGWDYKKLPGPIYYWLLAPLKIFNSITLILYIKITALYFVLILLSREIKKIFGKDLLFNFLLLFSLMPVFIFTTRNLWNPSLIILFNSLQLLFFLKYLNSRQTSLIWIMSLVAVIGMQIHFSTLLIFISIATSVFISKESISQHKKHLLFSIAIILAWLGVWYFFRFIPEFNNQLSNFYGINSYLIERFFDLNYHISLSLLEIKDYDLFTMLFRSLSELGIISGPSIKYFSIALNVIFMIALIYSVIQIIFSFFKNHKTLDLFLIFHFLFFLISIFVLKNKEQVPYRYGLCLYPIQFLIICYGMDLGFKSKATVTNYFHILCLMTFIFYGYFSYKIIDAQNITGRTHHTNNDNLELTLRNKNFLYDYLKKNVNLKEDPFNYLHGRSVNKFRLKEMNWEQTTPYFSIYSMRTGNHFRYTEDIMKQQIQDNWLVQLKNLNELKDNPNDALKINEISSEALPKKLKISYFDSRGKMLLFQNWHNSGLIMPSAFVNNLSEVDKIVLDFYAETGSYPFLNLLIDDNERYIPAYQPNYEVLSLSANNENILPYKSYLGYFLSQNQYIFKLKPINNTSISIKLKLRYKQNNFSRVDIFLTDSLLPQEELFVKSEP